MRSNLPFRIAISLFAIAVIMIITAKADKTHKSKAKLARLKLTKNQTREGRSQKIVIIPKEARFGLPKLYVTAGVATKTKIGGQGGTGTGWGGGSGGGGGGGGGNQGGQGWGGGNNGGNSGGGGGGWGGGGGGNSGGGGGGGWNGGGGGGGNVGGGWGGNSGGGGGGGQGWGGGGGGNSGGGGGGWGGGNSGGGGQGGWGGGNSGGGGGGGGWGGNSGGGGQGGWGGGSSGGGGGWGGGGGGGHGQVGGGGGWGGSSGGQTGGWGPPPVSQGWGWEPHCPTKKEMKAKAKAQKKKAKAKKKAQKKGGGKGWGGWDEDEHEEEDDARSGRRWFRSAFRSNKGDEDSLNEDEEVWPNSPPRNARIETGIHTLEESDPYQNFEPLPYLLNLNTGYAHDGNGNQLLQSGLKISDLQTVKPVGENRSELENSSGVEDGGTQQQMASMVKGDSPKFPISSDIVPLPMEVEANPIFPETISLRLVCPRLWYAKEGKNPSMCMYVRV